MIQRIKNKWIEKSKDELIGLLVKFMVAFGIAMIMNIAGCLERWAIHEPKYEKVTEQRDSLEKQCHPKNDSLKRNMGGRL